MVLIHPLEDGNGRVHRYSLQQVLGQRGVKPYGIPLPLPKAIQHDLDGYIEALESCQKDRYDLIVLRATGNGNVEVLNDTADLYRFCDASQHVRFLSRCVDLVLERDIPDELVEMDRRDRVVKGVRGVLDLPDRLIDRFIQFTLRNDGTLSKSERKKEFPDLTDANVDAMQDMVREIYELEVPTVEQPSP